MKPTSDELRFCTALLSAHARTAFRMPRRRQPTGRGCLNALARVKCAHDVSGSPPTASADHGSSQQLAPPFAAELLGVESVVKASARTMWTGLETASKNGKDQDNTAFSRSGHGIVWLDMGQLQG
eukprot:CAMPEP_0177624926 /NCGR_PEP_ID=MMETSP0419_2-20121207/29789_1 /TAXON_ID=582737 /ORGANISM="Tetraselmis sp., Strain GSL018" /LENGTH=124 /DNA_ID=CAMNT_0019125763 /DNA_START=39 /DNA_END=409 /DNA_ORIENTATION=+